MSTFPYLSCQNVCFRYGNQTLFDDVSFAIHPGERWGILGPNGAGKSTLFSILTGRYQPDSGVLSVRSGIRLGIISQSFECPEGETVNDILRRLIPPDLDYDRRTREIESQLEAHSKKAELDHSIVENDAWQNQLVKLNEELADIGGRTTQNLIDSALAFGSLDGLSSRKFAELSGGQRKRLQIVSALLPSPDLLLLDEPTNHLDLETVDWLEECLLKVAEGGTRLFGVKDRNSVSEPVGILIVSHDRAVMDTIASNILEIEGGKARVYRGNYEAYMEQKSALELSQERETRALANTFRRELAWLRSGTKARTTKQVARIERAHALEKDLGKRKAESDRSFIPDFDFVTEMTSRQRNENDELIVVSRPMGSQSLLQVEQLTVPFPGTKESDKRFIAKNLDFVLKPRMRVALMGPNGCGKSTLLRYFAGASKSPSCRFHEDARIGYFDQDRNVLDKEDTPRHLLCPKGDFVHFGGRSLHITTYLQRFLFRGEDINRKIGELSGGEQARLLLAKLMLESGNLFVLDEPTNDLDIRTLQVLEENLVQFSGAIVFTSHDRYFLRKVATHYLTYHGEVESRGERLAQWQMYPDLDQALDAAQLTQRSQVAKAQPAPVAEKKAVEKKQGKLSFKEQRELDGCEDKITELETLISTLTEKLQSSYDSNSGPSDSAKIASELALKQKELENTFVRWEELLTKQQNLNT